MINYRQLDEVKESLKSAFRGALSIRSLKIDNFLEEGYVTQLSNGLDEVIQRVKKDPNAPKKHLHVSRKIGVHRPELMNQSHRDFFDEINSPRFIKYLEEVTGIYPIYPDPDLEGGGLHQIYPGGYLNAHTDFNFHPKHEKWQRKLNILFYMNEGWKPEWKGNLQLYSEDVSTVLDEIEPIANRMALFETSEISFHGHPEPLACPDGVTRKSLAAYFYTDWPDGLVPRSKTNYRLVPWQKKAIIEEVKNLRMKGVADREIKENLSQRYQLSALKELLPSVF